MSREISFRAWDNDNIDWLAEDDVDLLTIHLDGTYEIDRGWVVVYPDLTLEQYTGFKDKNGKEIYEGDIVKVNGEVALNDDICVDPIAKIVWVDSAAGFGEKFTVKKAPMMPIGLYKYEIIGNIHENPELLNPRNSTELGEIK